jgi:hypothetical protein
MDDTTKPTTIEIHPVAECFPMLPKTELKALAEDIRANGLKDPIITYAGKIIDGRNRYAACALAEVEPLFEEWQGGESLVGYVWSKNGMRRNLTPGQKAALGLEFERLLKEEAEERRPAGGRASGRPRHRGREAKPA